MQETLLEKEVKDFYDAHIQMGDWRHAWTPYFLSRRFGLTPDDAVSRSSVGSNDKGIDAFYLDPKDARLFIIQGKFSDAVVHVKAAVEQFRTGTIPFLIELLSGEAGKYALPPHIQKLHFLLCGDHARGGRPPIQSVQFSVLSTGDKELLLQSRAVQEAREKWHDNEQLRRFGEALGVDPELVVIDLLTPHDITGGTTPVYPAYDLPAELVDKDWETVHGKNRMRIVLVPLSALEALYRERGSVLYHRNVRSFLGEKTFPSKGIQQTLRQILVDRSLDPSVFPFYHSGISLACRDHAVGKDGNSLRLVEPYVLNGCQTVSTLCRFLNSDRWKAKVDRELLKRTFVQARIVQSSDAAFMGTMTVNNNRQSALPAWAFRANDDVQVKLQRIFRDQMRIYYERQEGSFRQDQSDANFAVDYSNSPTNPIKIHVLAQRIAIAMGKLTWAKHKSDIFEDEATYRKIFDASGLFETDLRLLVLIWRIGQWVKLGIRELCETYPKYEWVKKAEHLVTFLAVHILVNHPSYSKDIWQFASNTRKCLEFNDYLRDAVCAQVRMVLHDAGLEPEADQSHRPEHTSQKVVDRLRKALESRYGITVSQVWDLAVASA